MPLFMVWPEIESRSRDMSRSSFGYYVSGQSVSEPLDPDLHCFSYYLTRYTDGPCGWTVLIDRCDSAEEGALVTRRCLPAPANDACDFSCIPFDRSGEAVNLPHSPPPFWGAGCPAVGELVSAIGFASLSPVIV